MKWGKGRQKDSYIIKLSITEAIKISDDNVDDKFNIKLNKTLRGIINDYVKMNEEFKKKHGRDFNSSR